jgi:hypothetical protein
VIIYFINIEWRTIHTPGLIALVALVLVATILSIVAAKFRPRDGALEKPWPLEAKRQILSGRERALYQRLIQTLPCQIVLAQVQLRQVLNFQRGRRSPGVLNRVSQVSLECLISNPDTSIVIAVELDDATHSRESRRQAYARKSVIGAILEVVCFLRIPLERIEVLSVGATEDPIHRAYALTRGDLALDVEQKTSRFAEERVGGVVPTPRATPGHRRAISAC